MKRERNAHAGASAKRPADRRRRGAVAAQLAICMTTLCGFAALTVDVGVMYHGRTELQRTVDAAALAAAAVLGDYSRGNPQENARAAVIEYAQRNPVLNGTVSINPATDIIFGQASINTATGKYVFVENGTYPNAVRVQARRQAPLYFANIFGIRSKELSARATAVLTPRDICFVLDLSASHNDDSCLRSYKKTTINNRPVWEFLWDPETGAQPIENGLPSGPRLGNMRTWGTDVTGPGWNFAADTGLVRLPQSGSTASSGNWSLTQAWVSQTLSRKGFGTYNSAEVAVINAGVANESATYYRRRVRVALGLDRWLSGKPGGQAGGNGDNVIDASEVVPMIPYPSATRNPDTNSKKVGGSWDAFIDYVRSSSSEMCKYDVSNDYYGDPGLRYRYGLKTWVDFIQTQHPSNAASPGLAGAPTQPMGAVADGVYTSLNIIRDLDSNDLVGMASYGTVGYGPDDQPAYMSWLTDDLGRLQNNVMRLQAGMWTSYTNIAQGIDEGVNVLMNSPRQRTSAAKVMLLLTDGNANQTRNTPRSQSGGSSPYYDPVKSKNDALIAAREAHARGIRIYTISVGISADTDLMQTIADECGGEHYYATGSIQQYHDRLQQIFIKLGGIRPVVLID